VMTRRPVWNAGRVLGYTDPQTQLTENQAPTPAKPGIKAPEIDVWPGRRLLWTTGAGGTAVPLTRRDLMPNTGTCAGGCFTALLGTMGLTIAPTDITLGTRTVEFLRGGQSTSGSRDEILNTLSAYNAIPIGPSAGQAQRWSYFYQDDAPAPGQPPQFRTDGETDPKGYAHKLGDIFHSEPVVVEPPRFFQYLSANL